MSETFHKPPLLPIVIGMMVILLVLYPLSVGPAAWVVNNASCPEWLGYTLMTFYTPLEYMADNGPTWFHDAVYAYVLWWQSKSAPAASF